MSGKKPRKLCEAKQRSQHSELLLDKIAHRQGIKKRKSAYKQSEGMWDWTGRTAVNGQITGHKREYGRWRPEDRSRSENQARGPEGFRGENERGQHRIAGCIRLIEGDVLLNSGG
jgi:hypothetical protein